jgi:hypothetical protein
LLRRKLIGLLLCGYMPTAGAQEPAQLPGLHIRAKAYVRTWPDSARRAVRDSLTVARQRWTEARPERYDLAVRRAPAWIYSENDQRHDGHARTMRIRGDSIMSIVFERAPQYTRSTQWSDVTVDKIFRQLEAALADSTRQVVRLEFDPVLGYPRLWHTDDARNGYGTQRTDQSSAGEVVLFRNHAPNAGCRWWRRLTGRCS